MEGQYKSVLSTMWDPTMTCTPRVSNKVQLSTNKQPTNIIRGKATDQFVLQSKIRGR
jgi:hypothetical protein